MDLEHGSGSSKVTHPEITDGSESSKHVETLADVIDGSGSSKHSEAHPEVLDGSGSSILFEIDPHLFDGSQSSKHVETLADVIDGSGSSKHSEAHPEILDGSGSSKLFEIDPHLFDGSQSSKNVGTLADVIDGSESSKHSETCSDVIDRIGSSKHSKTHADFIDGSDSSKHISVHHEDTINEGHPHTPTKKLGPSSSASSFSSDSSEDLFQVNSDYVPKSEACNSSFPNPNEDTPEAIKEEDTSNNSSSKSKEHNNGSPGPTATSSVSNIAHESVVQHSMTPTRYPHLQVMDRSEYDPSEYDPSRIPRSVFERSKSIAPLEWSVASNESLFSLHIGNNSFSKDHMFLFGDYKSGELTKSAELTMFSPIPPVPVAEIDRKNLKIGGPTVVADETINDAARVSAGAQYVKKVPPPAVSRNISNLSNNSDESGTSVQSFAFPVKKKRVWPSCYCSNCSWAFRYCTWPSSYFKWPSCYCSKCSCTSCYCWNRSRKGLCCRSSTILAGGESSANLKPHAEQQQHEPPSPKVASKSTAKCWFPCLSPCLSSCPEGCWCPCLSSCPGGSVCCCCCCCHLRCGCC